MRVQDLIEQLQQLDPNMELVMQRDSEGNGYSPLSGVDANCIYAAKSTWHGEVYSSTWSADDAGMSEEEWSEFLQQPRCAVLYPVN